MNIYNSLEFFPSNIFSLFKDSMLPSLTAKQQKMMIIAAVVSAAFCCLVACYLSLKTIVDFKGSKSESPKDKTLEIESIQKKSIFFSSFS